LLHIGRIQYLAQLEIQAHDDIAGHIWRSEISKPKFDRVRELSKQPDDFSRVGDLLQIANHFNHAVNIPARDGLCRK